MEIEEKIIKIIKRSNVKGTLEDFKNRAIEVHGLKYDYSKSIYVGTNTKLIITCAQHGDFLQIPKKHLSGQGCPKCGKEIVRQSRLYTIDEFKEISNNIYKGFFNYSKVNFKTLNDKVIITCPKHGDFLQLAVSHKNGLGCFKCSKEGASIKNRRTLPEFLRNSKQLHGDKYSYEKVDYVNGKTHVDIFCKKHGYFKQTPNNHLDGYGCKSCSHIISNAQVQVEDFIKSLGVEIIRNHKITSSRLELDIYCPDYKLAFEYNGLRFHNENFKSKTYHLDKTNLASIEGIRVIHIWEDEWLFNRKKIESLIRICLHRVDNLDKHNARDCKILQISWQETRAFLEEIHLQGPCAPTKYCYGLFNKSKDLISVMCFTESTVKDGETIELIRFCSRGIVRGGFSKLLSHFIKITTFKKIVSFSENRWASGQVYSQFGFTKESTTDISYYWTKRSERFHRRGFQRKYLKLKLEIYDPDKTEVENCHINGYARIFDCGKDKWTLTL